MIRFFFITFCFLCLCGKMCFSQTTLLSNTKYQLETGTYLSTSGITPFWLRSNQYGIVPLQAPMLTFRGSAHKEYDSTKNENQKLKKFGYGYGFWGVANVGKQSALLLPEAYLKVRYGAFEFYGGRRREIMGLVDTTLSSGSYIWSGNALPMPKIQVSIPNYTSIIGQGLISVKGSFAHGWFGKESYVKGYYLHQKSLYGRIGKETWKTKFYGGVNHQVQWSGERIIVTDISTDYSKYASNIYAILYAILPSKNFTKPQYFTQTDLANRLGNHLGSIDVCIEYKLKSAQIRVYKQFIYDLGQLGNLTNADDGLYGVSFVLKQQKVLNNILIEYLFTNNQGSYVPFIPRLLKLKDKHPGEEERYFNHDEYWDGWANNKMTIGTPFIMNDKFLRDGLSSNIPYIFASNNKIKCMHVGLSGELSGINYIVKLSNSINFGETRYPFAIPIHQTSYFFHLTKEIVQKKSFLSVSFGGDFGKLLNNSHCISISLKKKFNKDH